MLRRKGLLNRVLDAWPEQCDDLADDVADGLGGGSRVSCRWHVLRTNTFSILAKKVKRPRVRNLPSQRLFSPRQFAEAFCQKNKGFRLAVIRYLLHCSPYLDKLNG